MGKYLDILIMLDKHRLNAITLSFINVVVLEVCRMLKACKREKSLLRS